MELQQPSAAVSAAATNIAAAVTASAIASLSPTNAMDSRIPVAHIVRVDQVHHAAIVPSAVVVQPSSSSAMEARRDPVLRRFEEYLLSKLRPSDVVTDERDGVWLFNVNQAAYIIEGSVSDEEKYCARRRVKNGLPELQHSLKRTHQSNKGETHGQTKISQMKTQTFFVWVLIWRRQTERQIFPKLRPKHSLFGS
jgi:hypothetical protein